MNARIHDCCINTKDLPIDQRDGGTIYFQQSIPSGAVAYAVTWVNIPFSFYNIDDTNNKMRIEATSTALGNVFSSFRITFTPGSYTIDTLAGEFKRAISQSVDEATGLIPFPGAANYTLALLQQSTRIVIYVKDPDNLGYKFKLVFDADTTNKKEAGSALADMLGFTSGDTYTSAVNALWVNGENIGAVHSQIALRSLSLAPSHVNVHSNLAIESNPAPVSIALSGKDDLIAVVPMAVNYASYMLSQTQIEPIKFNSRTQSPISKIELYLTTGIRNKFLKYRSNAQLQSSFSYSDYLPLNGDGFQVNIRFYLDDSTTNNSENMQ